MSRDCLHTHTNTWSFYLCLSALSVCQNSVCLHKIPHRLHFDIKIKKNTVRRNYDDIIIIAIGGLLLFGISSIRLQDGFIISWVVLLDSIIHFYNLAIQSIKQPKRIKFTNCSQFLSHNFFGLDFHFYVIFLLIGIGQLNNDV